MSQTERERVESYPKDGKEDDEEILIRSEDARTQRLKIDVKTFSRSHVIVKNREEDDFKPDVWRYHTAFRRENPVCPHPPYIASPRDQGGPVNV